MPKTKLCDIIVVYLFRERCKKKLKKNLTSVSFAFTHTYTAVKTNSFRFFPQAYMENFEKCAKTGNMGTLGGGGGANSPLWPRYHPIGFKTSTLKENCLLNYCWEKKRKKTNISPFSATHTYIKLTVSFFYFFLHLPLRAYYTW